MPIKGLTDSITPSFPRLGVIKKGAEKTANAMGKELDYFRFVGTNQEIQSKFNELYGDKPKKLRAYMAYPGLDDSFESWCEIWDATGLVHRCDSENMVVWREGSAYLRGSKPCTGGHAKNDPFADSRGRLKIILPELVEAGFAGYVQINTGGKHDLIEIQSRLSAVIGARGDLSGVPFIIERVEEKVSSPGFGTREGQRSMVTKFNIKLMPDSEWMRVMIELQKQKALTSSNNSGRLSLPAPEMIDVGPSENPEEDIIRWDASDITSESLEVDDSPIPEFGGAVEKLKMDKLVWAQGFVTEKGTVLGKLDLTAWHKLADWYVKLKPAEITEDRKNLYKAVNILIDNENAILDGAM